jgi:diguanylate cyclase (GGDEF)-like protein
MDLQCAVEIPSLAAGAEPAGNTAVTLAPIRLLVVDDDDVDRAHVIRCLRQFPGEIQIRQASSLAEANAAVQETPFDTIIVDSRLGDGEGLQLVSQLSAQKNKICPIILVTGYSTERDAVTAMREGVYDYIPKNELDASRLVPAIQNGLRWAHVQAKLLQAEQELRRRSLYDTLTELPNRDLFFDRLEHACANALRYQIPFAVMMMDLDHFKSVNDTLGHAAGDEVLRQTGKRLMGACRQSDTISRLAGDEFVAVCLGVNDAETALVVAEKMLAIVNAPMVVDGQVLSVGISIGVALCPVQATATGPLMALADAAMYQAKTGLRKIVCASPTAARPAALPALSLLNDLEQAIDRREFVMYYQPKLNLETYQVVGVEALMRWQTRNGSLVMPDQFIPVIEPSNLLHKFTLMSIELVLSQMADWAQRGIMLDVALNISAKMLEDGDLAEHFKERLSQFNVRADMLTLEITETAIIQHPDAARKVAAELTAAGIKLSIDDFGSGFTSFSHLQDFKIPEIKIDKNYIINLKENSFGASLVKSISVFCKSEGIKLVAEGVEHRESWQLLCELGCNIGQGYSIARPAAAPEFETWLADSKPILNPTSHPDPALPIN